MTYEILYSTVVAILTAIITGGFILVFVEIGNRKNREMDPSKLTILATYEQINLTFSKNNPIFAKHSRTFNKQPNIACLQ